MRCRTAFTFTNRKHHCRNCGNVFCGSCSSKSIPLPHFGIAQAVRVDDGCYAKLTDKSRSITFQPDRTSQSSKHRSAPSMQPRNARIDDRFDEDLKRALEMSLEEVKSHSGQGHVPQSQPKAHSSANGANTNGKAKSSKAKPSDEDDDPEL